MKKSSGAGNGKGKSIESLPRDPNGEDDDEEASMDMDMDVSSESGSSRTRAKVPIEEDDMDEEEAMMNAPQPREDEYEEILEPLREKHKAREPCVCILQGLDTVSRLAPLDVLYLPKRRGTTS